MRINWKVRFKNPYFWIGLVGIILTTSGAALETLTSWGAVADWLSDLISNPFALGGVALAILGVLYDPTTKGVGDSTQALAYNTPKSVMDDLAAVYTDDRRDPEDITE